ncbi:hypothetical protein [Dendronalium sp. ChiSLP03b]|uniref:hypothetical protein n=1 Tax=Dendronalium sp. ChiSLP03b TaxID=3075381 RepID=UPI002AD3AFA8|nr:hypothetical protein [Dendronalium sp. ChiSLP03b]MDZ8203241.1 hypothetical protein [Dendronalium sp. ChiSLP03b]
MRLFPHFIASSLGTELIYFNQEQYGERDKIWEKNLIKTVFSDKVVNDLVNFLKLDNINLISQPQIEDCCFLKNYYYYQQNKQLDAQALLKIKDLVIKANIEVNISKCNPLSGDPDNCYDVDFIPSGTGKKHIVNFIFCLKIAKFCGALSFLIRQSSSLKVTSST